MSDPAIHIDAWQAAGVLDAETADRLRAASAVADAPAASQSPGAPAPSSARAAMVSAYGRDTSIVEMFGYLGAAFLIGAFDAFVARISTDPDGRTLTFAIGMAVGTAVLLALGGFLLRGDERRRRAAGMAFLVATGHAAAGGAALAGYASLEPGLIGVVATVVATGVALVTRLVHPSLLTQLGFVAALTGLAAATLGWVRMTMTGQAGEDVTNPSGSLPFLVGGAAAWLGFAFVLGLIALAEARTGTEPATRRAGLTRVIAAFVAVTGFVTEVTRSGPTSTFEWHRILEPWIADVAILVLAAVLVERAFRRDSAAFLLGAAIALFAALTDFNYSYLSTTPEVGLVIEGLILLAAGFSVDRLRRRLGHRLEPAAA